MPDHAYFAHRNALIEEGACIGLRTRVWAFAHILGGAKVGDDCNICDHVFIEGKVVIGDRVTIKCGVYLWDGITIEDDVFVGPAAAFTNDVLPRSRKHPDRFPVTLLKVGCSIGANATILPAVRIGSWSIVGAGAVVTRDVPDYSLVVGNPARFRRWICSCTRPLDFVNGCSCCCCGRNFSFAANEVVREISDVSK